MEEQHNEQELTLAELNESIQKLRANRDLILVEKKAAKRVTEAMKAECDTLNSKCVMLAEQLEKNLKQTGMNALLSKVDVGDEVKEFMAHQLGKHVQGTVDNDVYGVKFVDHEGKDIEFDDLVKTIRDDPKNAPFVLGSRASGGAGPVRYFESTPKQNPSQFGFGKK